MTRLDTFIGNGRVDAPKSSATTRRRYIIRSFLVIIGFFALALAIWYFAHEQIALVVLKVRYAEAQLVSFFTDSIYKEMAIIRNTSPAAATFNKLASISTAVGNYMRYPIAALLRYLGSNRLFK